jgi:hypothetical protein
VHAFVATQVGELGVGLVADFALERLDRRVDVGVLLEAAGRGERFAAFRARVAPCAAVLAADVALQVAWIREYLENESKPTFSEPPKSS